MWLCKLVTVNINMSDATKFCLCFCVVNKGLSKPYTCSNVFL